MDIFIYNGHVYRIATPGDPEKLSDEWAARIAKANGFKDAAEFTSTCDKKSFVLDYRTEKIKRVLL
jgi:hypothetical protein